MIKILSNKEITKEEFFSTDNQARLHVPPNEPWVAFEIPKDTIVSYEVCTLEITYNTYLQNVIGLILVTKDKRLVIAVRGISYNDLYACYLYGTQEETIEVPKTVLVGYSDSVYRRKYISTTAKPYWNSNMLPVVITK